MFFNPDSMKSSVDEFMRMSGKASVDEFMRMTGQPIPSSRGAYIESFLESLALLFRRTIREADEISGKHTEVIHLMGGGAQNPLLCQYTADATGCTVMAGPVEATAIGNAMMQAVAVGRLASIEDARRLVRASFEPSTFNPENKSALDEAASRFDEIMKL